MVEMVCTELCRAMGPETTASTRYRGYEGAGLPPPTLTLSQTQNTQTYTHTLLYYRTLPFTHTLSRNTAARSLKNTAALTLKRKKHHRERGTHIRINSNSFMICALAVREAADSHSPLHTHMPVETPPFLLLLHLSFIFLPAFTP